MALDKTIFSLREAFHECSVCNSKQKFLWGLKKRKYILKSSYGPLAPLRFCKWLYSTINNQRNIFLQAHLCHWWAVSLSPQAYVLVGGMLRVMQLTFITPDESCTGIGLIKDSVSLALEWPWTGLLDDRYPSLKPIVISLSGKCTIWL